MSLSVPVSMDDRSRAVLRAAVEKHICTGEPVASRSLERGNLQMSSALIRAVMSRLEADGFLFQPHVSAGRIPTQSGYRVYVDQLMAPGCLASGGDQALRELTSAEKALKGIMRECVLALARVTGLASFAVSAVSGQYRHRHVELVRLRRAEVLGIFATTCGTVYHRVVSVERDIPQHELDRFANYLNERFAGLTLSQIRTMIREELEQVEQSYQTLRARAFALSQRTLPDEPAHNDVEVVVGGQHHLLAMPEFADPSTAGPVFEDLERRATWVALLDAAMGESGVTVMIGAENPAIGLHDCSVVATSVPWDEGLDGTVGLVGPTRLAYGTAIATLELARQSVMAARRRRYRV